MASRLNLRLCRILMLAFAISGGALQLGPRGAVGAPSATPNGLGPGFTQLSGHPATRAAAVSQISVSAPDTVRATEGDSIYILATAASGSPYSIISIEINGVPPNCTFWTNTPTAISPSATLSGYLGFQTSGVWHLRWAASDQFGARDTASTELIIRGNPPDTYPSRVFTTSGNQVIRLPSGNRAWCVQVEPIRGFPTSDIVLSSMELAFGGNRISCDTDKTRIDGDRDGNGVTEVSACFAKDALKTLFAGLPPGKSIAEVQVHGTYVSFAELRGRLLVEVVVNTSSHLASSISPNPLNPDAVLEFSTLSSGPISVSMFDLQGRLVRDLWNEPFAQAGDHRVQIDGRGRHGERLASGVYLYRIATKEGVASGRIVVLK